MAFPKVDFTDVWTCASVTFVYDVVDFRTKQKQIQISLWLGQNVFKCIILNLWKVSYRFVSQRKYGELIVNEQHQFTKMGHSKDRNITLWYGCSCREVNGIFCPAKIWLGRGNAEEEENEENREHLATNWIVVKLIDSRWCWKWRKNRGAKRGTRRRRDSRWKNNGTNIGQTRIPKIQGDLPDLNTKKVTLFIKIIIVIMISSQMSRGVSSTFQLLLRLCTVRAWKGTVL